MTTEKWTPKVGDVVAIVRRKPVGADSISRARVTRVLKRYVDVEPTGSTGGTTRRFSLADLRETGRSGGWSVPRIERWTEAHDEVAARRGAINDLYWAAEVTCGSDDARARLEAMPTARLEEAAAFLRALVEEAKAAKP